ncbi:MAG: type II toxin-antitoxin system VapC family toxin [Deltaproteobacteria bacterium]|nr:type II toxin-antitoxin system VapC family toxin [Deltaproteobacteria bacterium]
MSFLLDTDICVFALRHHKVVLERLAALGPDDVAVASMTEAELLYGACKSREPDRSRASVLAFLAPIARLPFDSNAALFHAEARFALRKRPVGERDLVIASTALSNRLVLVTHNARELSRVPGIRVEDWAAGKGA